MSHVYRWHPQLSATIDGPMVGKHLLHLQQSDIDGACGLHCALMALMLFGLVERDDLDELSKAKKKPLASFWKQSVPYYFRGTRPNQLKSIMKPYNDYLTCMVVAKKPAHEVSTTLHADGLCIVGIRNREFDHWVLAVGIGGKEGSKNADKFLILDPGLPAMPMLPWNATLTVNASRRGLHLYECAEGDYKVFFDEAVLLLQDINECELDRDTD